MGPQWGGVPAFAKASFAVGLKWQFAYQFNELVLAENANLCQGKVRGLMDVLAVGTSSHWSTKKGGSRNSRLLS